MRLGALVGVALAVATEAAGSTRGPLQFVPKPCVGVRPQVRHPVSHPLGQGREDLGSGTVSFASRGSRPERARRRQLVDLLGIATLSSVFVPNPPVQSAELVANADEPVYFDFDDGHLATLLPPGYVKIEEEEERQTELPAYLMTPDAVAQRELKRKSFSQLRNDRTGSTIVFTTTPCSSFKITFTRVNDISDYGTIEEVGERILPKQLKNLRYNVRTEEFAEKKTVRGTIKPLPRRYYRYDFATPDGLDHIAINLAVVRGFVYTMTVTCPEKFWQNEQGILLESLDTMTVA